MSDTKKIVIHTDGGARGNPGPVAIGNDIKKYSERIENATNNVAEYKAVIFALKKAKQLIGKKNTKLRELEVYTDSELVAKQLNGLYKIKDKNLGLLFIEIWNLMQDFKKVIIAHIPRESNRGADKLVNQALDTLF